MEKRAGRLLCFATKGAHAPRRRADLADAAAHTRISAATSPSVSIPAHACGRPLAGAVRWAGEVRRQVVAQPLKPATRFAKSRLQTQDARVRADAPPPPRGMQPSTLCPKPPSPLRGARCHAHTPRASEAAPDMRRRQARAEPRASWVETCMQQPTLPAIRAPLRPPSPPPAPLYPVRASGNITSQQTRFNKPALLRIRAGKREPANGLALQ
eukprot:354852-Chlamydomonas_euryale.AAC.7